MTIKNLFVIIKTQPIVYDALGNPTTYRGNTLTWTKISCLASYGSNTFEYNVSGIRFKKNNTIYTLDGNKILKETDGTKTISYYYGVDGVVGFNYNGNDYYYRKNLQGDVIEIYRADGAKVANYIYDAWGKVIECFNANSENIATLNPFRYRSYYYDTETNLYYLEARYYDPETGRFISADDISYLDPETINGLNLYAYCVNNPVMCYDPSGCFLLTAFLICTGLGLAVGFGATAVADYQDDGEIFNGSISTTEYVTNTVLGGAVGAVAGSGTAYLVGGLASTATKLVSDSVSSLAYGINNFGSIQDYAVAFSFGGLLKGLPLSKLGNIEKPVKVAADVLIRPIVNQIPKVTTANSSFNREKYAYDVITRASTYGTNWGILKTELLGEDFRINIGRAIARGLFGGLEKVAIFN